MRSDVPGIAWPPIIDGARAVLAALLRQLDETQWLPPDDIAARQREQLGLLAAFLDEHSPFFSRRLAAAGLTAAALASPGGLAAMPQLRRADLQTETELYCRDVPRRHRPVWDSHTAGSTGEPVVVRRTAINQLYWSAMTVRDHLWHRRDVSGGLAIVRAKVPRVTPRGDWGAPMNLLFRTGPALTVPVSTDAAELYRHLARFEPVSLLIYPNALAALVQHMEATGGTLEALRFVRTIGEALAPETRQAAHAVLGIAPTDAYTAQELGYVALQCPASGLYHVMAETMIVEVVDEHGSPCRPGQIGRILVTDLHNFATPVIRYDIGDYAEVAEPCPCGRGLPTLARILGRERNLIRMPDGTRHWPLTGYDRYREIAGVRQYQLAQIDRDTVEVRLVTDAPVTASQEAELAAHITATLGHPFRIQFRYFEGRIPVPPSGKFEEFVCLIRD